MNCSVTLLDVFNFYRDSKASPGDDDEFYRAVKNRGGLPCRRFKVGMVLKESSLLPLHIRHFLMKEGDIYVLPIEDLYSIRAMFFRSVFGKEFRILNDGKPLFYGLHRFKDFKFGDLVILSEGIKDAEAIAKFHPYSLAVLGNHVSQKQAEVLKRLTNNSVFMADNDVWGRKSVWVNKKAGCKEVYFVHGCKDPGEIWGSGDYENLEVTMKTILMVHGRKNFL